MKLTYYVPVTEQSQDTVCAQVRCLFQVEPSIVRRATELQVDLDALTTGEIPLLVGQIPYAVFTLDDPSCLSREQQQWVCRQPGCEVKREYGPAEVLYERIKGDTQAHKRKA